jgi:hypothetical protein
VLGLDEVGQHTVVVPSGVAALAPPVDAGRNPAETLEKYERKLAEREEGAARRRAEAADRERV